MDGFSQVRSTGFQQLRGCLSSLTACMRCLEHAGACLDHPDAWAASGAARGSYGTTRAVQPHPLHASAQPWAGNMSCASPRLPTRRRCRNRTCGRRGRTQTRRAAVEHTVAIANVVSTNLQGSCALFDGLCGWFCAVPEASGMGRFAGRQCSMHAVTNELASPGASKTGMCPHHRC